MGSGTVLHSGDLVNKVPALKGLLKVGKDRHKQAKSKNK